MTSSGSRPAGLQAIARRAVLFGLPLFAANARPQSRTAVHHDSIDGAIEHQVIENFGASDCWRTERLIAWSEESRQKVADLLFSRDTGIGLSCWRFNIGAGINPRIVQPWRTIETFEVAPRKYDWSRQAGQRWFLRAAKQRGVPQFLAFSNSATARMTRNGLTFATKDLGTTNLRSGMETEYARYLVDILDHFRNNPDPNERISFDYVSPANEPQWDWSRPSQEGDRASNEDLKRLLLSLHSDLRARALPTEIIAPESGSLPDMWAPNQKMTRAFGVTYGDYLNALAGAPSMAGVMNRRICYHSYWSDLIDGALVEHRRTLGNRFREHPGWKLWQTEYCVMQGPAGKGGNGRDLGMDTALDVARVIHLDVTLANVSAWQWWTALSEADYKDGLIYTDWKKPGDPETIYPSRLLWVMGNFSRFVRPGMVRVALAGPKHDIRGLMGSAFRARKSGTIAVVYVNMSPAPCTVELSFQNVGRPRSITPYVTSDRNDLERRAALRPKEPVTIPSRSVVTLIIDMT